MARKEFSFFQKWCTDKAKKSGTPALHHLIREKVTWQAFVDEANGALAEPQNFAKCAPLAVNKFYFE